MGWVLSCETGRISRCRSSSKTRRQHPRAGMAWRRGTSRSRRPQSYAGDWVTRSIRRRGEPPTACALSRFSGWIFRPLARALAKVAAASGGRRRGDRPGQLGGRLRHRGRDRAARVGLRRVHSGWIFRPLARVFIPWRRWQPSLAVFELIGLPHFKPEWNGGEVNESSACALSLFSGWIFRPAAGVSIRCRR
jgi:hypothetical protein